MHKLTDSNVSHYKRYDLTKRVPRAARLALLRALSLYGKGLARGVRLCNDMIVDTRIPRKNVAASAPRRTGKLNLMHLHGTPK